MLKTGPLRNYVSIPMDRGLNLRKLGGFLAKEPGADRYPVCLTRGRVAEGCPIGIQWSGMRGARVGGAARRERKPRGGASPEKTKSASPWPIRAAVWL